MIINPFVFSSASGSQLQVRMLFNGADGSTTFTDEQGHTITGSGSPVIATAQSIEGGSSLYLNGSSNLTAADNNDFMFPGDFKIECWCRPDSLSATGVIYSNQLTNGDANGFALYRNVSSLDVWSAGSNIMSSGSGVFAANTWVKIRLERISGVLRAYANDVQVGSSVSSSSNYNRGIFRLGVYSPGGQYWTGYIDSFDIWSG